MPDPTSTTSGAVFLSYAREDTDAARRIVEALRAFGVDAWFDQSELRGGDTWDSKIRGQIRACALFMPIVSARTQGRAEGYFRREWKLAVERTHDMAAGVAFIVPVVIDDTPESEAAVPDEFMCVQWTRLPHGVPSPQFVEQVKRLLETPRRAAPAAARLSHGSGANLEAGRPRPDPRDEGVAPPGSGVGRALRARLVWMAGAAAVILLGVFGWMLRQGSSDAGPPTEPAARRPASAQGYGGQGTAPPTSGKSAPALGEKSVAVLPFGNVGADRENAEFAEGVHEDVITNLVKIRDLKVISRASVLTYRDTAARSLKKIAAELGVATVLEGSVRRAGNRVKVTAVLIDARTEAHLWAETYEGELTDIFALQAKLAQQIAGALNATLTPGERALIERRPTQNQAAYETYLRARLLDESITERSSAAKYRQVVTVYEQAVTQDPAFGLAHARLAALHGQMYWFGTLDPSPERLALARAASAAAQRLAADAPETHLARGSVAYFVDLDWTGALAEYRIAQVGLPNDARLSGLIAFALRRLGRWSEALAELQHAVALNPRELYVVSQSGTFQFALRRFAAARDTYARLAVDFPNDAYVQEFLIRSRYALDGDRASLLRAWVAMPPLETDPQGLLTAYGSAMLAGDHAGADHLLADPRATPLRGLGGILNEPVSLHRALVAFVRGQREAAVQFAEQAISDYRAMRRTPRQEAFAQLGIARAKALAGRGDEAVREAQAALALARHDAYAAKQGTVDLGWIYVLANRNDDALAVLRELMQVPCNFSPHEIRHDPIWSRLKDDPRFEEILKSAKPL